MNILIQALMAAIPVYLFFALGYWLRKRGLVAVEEESVLMRLAMDIGYPCLIFYNIIHNIGMKGDAVLASPLFCAQAITSGYLEMLIGVIAAYVIARLMRLKIGGGLRTFVVCSGVQNYVFFAVPVVLMLSQGADDPTLGVLFIHNVGSEIFVWTLAVFLISGKRDSLRLGALARGPLIAVVVSLIIVWTGLVPYVAQPPIMRFAEMVGGITTPLSLALCGCFIYELTQRSEWNYSLMRAALVARLFIIPALILLLAWALPFDPLIKRIMVIQSAIPSGVIAVMIARRFGGMPELGTQIVLSTTLCSAVTFPLWLILGDYFVVPVFP